MNLSDLEEQFEHVGLRHGGVFLLPVPEAIRFIDECEKHGLHILGVEGFRVYGDAIQPFQEHSFDFEAIVPESHQFTRSFVLQRLNDAIWFEVIAASV